MKALGPVLTGVRTYRKKNYAQVARECGLAPGTIVEIEAGTTTPSVDTLRRICKWIGITPSTFLDADDVEIPGEASVTAPHAQDALPGAKPFPPSHANGGSMFAGLTAGK